MLYLLHYGGHTGKKGASETQTESGSSASYSTTTTIADPKSWTKPQPMIDTLPEGGTKTKGLDFWVICDATKAHLLYTSDDGHFWRRETAKQNFPLGWSKPELLLKDKALDQAEAILAAGIQKHPKSARLHLIRGDLRRDRAWSQRRAPCTLRRGGRRSHIRGDGGRER